MIHIDGSVGEGGGQVIRTSLSLAAITGQSILIEKIRAQRPKPGLAAQHLTAVRATAAICRAEVRGDSLGSTTLEFIPTCSPQAGTYTFDVSDVGIPSAGACTLVLQTILLPLALASADSQVIIRGGTHVPFSPPLTYIEQVYLPIIRQMGVQAEVQLNAWGWYPKGGGEVELRVSGGSTLSGINLMERGVLRQVRGLAVVTELPSHIPQRMASRAENLLHKANLKSYIQPLRERGVAPGAGIFLTAEYENICAGFSALGRVGLPADKVAQSACQDLLDFYHTGATVDVHLGDQLLLPAALAINSSQYSVAEISTHLTTNAWVIEQFGVARITVDKFGKMVAIEPTTTPTVPKQSPCPPETNSSIRSKDKWLMIAHPQPQLMTPQKYLEWEEQQPIKYEYINGQVFAMTGGTLPHNSIALNLASSLKNHLRGKRCKVFMADAKVGVSQNGPFHYPDVMVTCDSRDRTARQVVYHPCLIVEVLSPGTEDIDRGKKFRNYRRIDTLKEYVMIEAETMNVDCYRLNEKGKWELTAYSLEETAANETDLEVHLTSVDFHCPISLLYEDVVFPEDNPQDSLQG